jgi:4-amino-4-deoxy-L-arabinose transferase-like glycosyltransferase
MKDLIVKVCVVLLIGTSLLFMLSHLDADPPLKLSYSQGLQFDAPSKCHNARNKVLFGRWDTDQWAPYLHSPIYTICQTMVFKLFGVGFAQMRIFPALLSAAGLLLLYLIVARSLNQTLGLICLTMASSCYPYLMFGRSGLLEPCVTFFILLSTLLLIKSYSLAEGGNEKTSRLWMAAAALAAALAFLSKPIASYFVAAFIVTVLAHPPINVRRSRMTALIWALFPIVLFLAITETFTPNHINRETGFWFERAQLHKILYSWIHQPIIVNFRAWLMPIMVPAAFGLYVAHNLLLKNRIGTKKIALLLMAVTIILGSQFFSVVGYRPMRYYIPLLAPSFILTMYLIYFAYQWVKKPAAITIEGKLKPLIWWLVVSCGLKFTLLDFMFCKGILLRTVTPWSRMAIAAVLTGIVLALIRKFGKHATLVNKLPPIARQAIFFIICLMLFTQYMHNNLKPLKRWFKKPHHTQHVFSRFAGAHLKDAVLAGPCPEFAVMENRFTGIKVTNYNLNWDWMQKGKITHIIIPERLGHVGQYNSLFPKLMNDTKFIDRFEISGLVYQFLAVDLEPVNFTVKNGPESDLIIVTTENRDRHSYQWISLLSINRNDTEKLWINVQIALSDPESENQFKLDPPDGEVEIYALNSQLWKKAISCPTKHATITEDINSKSLRVIRMQPGTVDGDCTLNSSYTGDPGVVIGAVTLKLIQSNPGDKVTLSWVIGTETVRTLEVREKSLPDTYTTFVLAANIPPGLTGEFKLLFQGDGTLLISDLLAISAEKGYLKDNSAWYEIIAPGR